VKKYSSSFFIIIAGFILVTIGVIWLVVIPQGKQLMKTIKDFQQSKRDIADLTGRVEKITSLEQHSGQLSEMTQIVSDYLPDSQKEGPFIVETEKVFQDNGVASDIMKITGMVKATGAKQTTDNEEPATAGATTTISSTTTSVPTPKVGGLPGTAQTGFSFSFKGSFPSFMNFLKTWEGIRRFFVLQSIQVKTTGDDEITVRADGMIFYKKQVSILENLENLDINFNKLEDLKKKNLYSTPVSPQEPGYGRDNPFVAY
jgi:hypothetical protein